MPKCEIGAEFCCTTSLLLSAQPSTFALLQELQGMPAGCKVCKLCHAPIDCFCIRDLGEAQPLNLVAVNVLISVHQNKSIYFVSRCLGWELCF